MTMTDEQFVSGWLQRKWGINFSDRFPADAATVRKALEDGVLMTCTAEGVGSCSCNSRNDMVARRAGGPIETPNIRFYLSEDSFLMICPTCDGWSIFPTRKKERKDRGLE